MKAKANPELIARARELRDPWMEHVSADGNGIGGIESVAGEGQALLRGKYDVTRRLPEPRRLIDAEPARLRRCA